MQTTPPLFIGDLVQSRRIIYQPSSFAMQSLLYLQETGSLTAIKPHTSSRQNLSSFLFFYVEEGEGSLTYQNQTLIVSNFVRNFDSEKSHKSIMLR